MKYTRQQATSRRVAGAATEERTGTTVKRETEETDAGTWRDGGGPYLPVLFWPLIGAAVRLES